MIVELWLCAWMWLRLCVCWVANEFVQFGKFELTKPTFWAAWAIGILASYVVSFWQLRHSRNLCHLCFSQRNVTYGCVSFAFEWRSGRCPLDWDWVDFVAGLLWWPHNPSIVRTITYARYKSKPDYPHLPFFRTHNTQGNVWGTFVASGMGGMIIIYILLHMNGN